MLTRAKVRAQLEQLSEVSEGIGVPTAGPNGEEMSEEVVGTVYRDTKRCIFCKNRSEKMHFGMMQLDAELARAAGLTGVSQVRLLFYGLCRTHERLATQDPALWLGK